MTTRARFGRWWVVAILVVLVAVGGVALIASQHNNSSTIRSCLGSSDCLFQIRGTVAVTSQSGGKVNLTVDNLANYPFMNIDITGTTPSLNGLASSAPFTYNGTAISTANPLQIGSSSSGSFTFTSGGSTGTTYTIIVTATMTNGQTVTEEASFVASES